MGATAVNQELSTSAITLGRVFCAEGISTINSHRLLRMLQSKGKITRDLIALICSCSQERMTYLPEESKVTYQSKACPRRRSGNGKEEKVFDALEWLGAITSHVPNKGEQMVR